MENARGASARTVRDDAAEAAAGVTGLLAAQPEAVALTMSRAATIRERFSADGIGPLPHGCGSEKDFRARTK